LKHHILGLRSGPLSLFAVNLDPLPQIVLANCLGGAGEQNRFRIAVSSTAGFDHLLPAAKAICRCPSRSKG
jgi:hypothetical protein